MYTAATGFPFLQISVQLMVGLDTAWQRTHLRSQRLPVLDQTSFGVSRFQIRVPFEIVVCRAEHRTPYKAYRWDRMYGTRSRAGTMSEIFWPYPLLALTATVYSYLCVTVTVPVTVTLLNRVYSVAFISYCSKLSQNTCMHLVNIFWPQK
jgi:hypothetical protein